MTETDPVAAHRAEAERWLTLVHESPTDRGHLSPGQCIQIAQIHATLALAVATARQVH